MNAGRLGRRITNNTAKDESPDWSPDGSRIAFISDRDGNNEVYVMNPTARADQDHQQYSQRRVSCLVASAVGATPTTTGAVVQKREPMAPTGHTQIANTPDTPKPGGLSRSRDPPRLTGGTWYAGNGG